MLCLQAKRDIYNHMFKITCKHEHVVMRMLTCKYLFLLHFIASFAGAPLEAAPAAALHALDRDIEDRYPKHTPGPELLNS